jgi:hypothetical protein
LPREALDLVRVSFTWGAQRLPRGTGRWNPGQLGGRLLGSRHYLQLQGLGGYSADLLAAWVAGDVLHSMVFHTVPRRGMLEEVEVSREHLQVQSLPRDFDPAPDGGDQLMR